MTQLHPRDPENRQQNRFLERRFSKKNQLQLVEWESVASFGNIVLASL